MHVRCAVSTLFFLDVQGRINPIDASRRAFSDGFIGKLIALPTLEIIDPKVDLKICKETCMHIVIAIFPWFPF
jgi:hypothetical protein